MTESVSLQRQFPGGRLLTALKAVREPDHAVAIAVVFLLLVMYGVIFFYAANYGFWRHDSIAYLTTYAHKLVTEGRWVNWVLFSVLKQIPNLASWLVSFLCLFWFLFFVSGRIFRSRLTGLISAGILMAFPGLFSQLNWPTTILPAAVFLAVSTLLVDRVRYVILLPFLSLVAFGIYPWIIYLFPLLYLDRRFPSAKAAALWWAKLTAVWGASFVLGYVFANTLVHSLTGNPIRLAEFRHPNPAETPGELAANLATNIRQIPDHFVAMFPLAAVLAAALLALAVWSFRAGFKDREWLPFVTILCVGGMVAFCHYVIVAPAGIVIQFRSLVPFYVGFVLVVLALGFVFDRRLVIGLVCLFIALPSWYASYRSVVWFSRVSTEMRADARRSLPDPARTYAGIIVDAREFNGYYRRLTVRLPRPYGKFFEGMNRPYRWERGLNEEGNPNVQMCPARIGRPFSPKCRAVLNAIPSDACRGNDETICVVGVTAENELILRLQE